MPNGPPDARRSRSCHRLFHRRCWLTFALCFCSTLAAVSLLEASIGWQGFAFQGVFEGGMALVEFAAFHRSGTCVGESCPAIGSKTPADFMLLALNWRRDRTVGGVTDREIIEPTKRLSSDVGLMVHDLSTQAGAHTLSENGDHQDTTQKKKAGQPMESLPNPWSHMDLQGFDANGAANSDHSTGSTPGLLPVGLGPHIDLHLPNTSLQELHGGEHGPLSRLLLRLRKEICDAVEVEERQFGILGIKGKFKQEGVVGEKSSQLRNDQDSQEPRSHQEVLLTFEIFRSDAKDSKQHSVEKVMSALAAQLKDHSSTLLAGPLGSILKDATVNLSLNELDATMAQRRSLSRMSALALPIGISAAFTGILIWLCAW